MKRLLPIAAAAILAFSPAFGTARTQLPLVPDRVEEDWELVVGDPNQSLNGPQISTTMSPVGDNNRNFVTFNLNYREGGYRAGGMELQVWTGAVLITKDSDKREQLSTSGETVTWTQSMSVAAGQVTFSVDNGHSETWNNFGQGNNLILSYDSTATDLTLYNPDISARNSGVGWQSNRVRSLRITEVRYYNNNQLIRTDSSPRECSLGR